MKVKRLNIPNLIFLVLGFIGIADTIIVRVFVQNMDLGVLLPSVIGVFFIILYLRPLWDKYYIKLNNVIKRIIYWGFLVFLIIFIIVEGCIILGGVYKPRPEQQPEYVVVLGAGILGNGMPTLSLANRLERCIEYAAEHPDTKIIVSGGQGRTEPMTEAEAMARYLVDRGVEPERIILEDRSTSTMENFKYTREIIGEVDEIAFITNNFHIFRSGMLAKRNGFKAYGYGAPTPGIVLVNSYLREFFALIKSLLLDY
ncbi:MAG TPA: YdcF family protein [Ruminiclostridium sp.]|nr:YdcF family protein [Clostridiaceae bacterium]HAA25898.1 YdcF family protein [Ruminiclostridium sp.]